MILTIMISIALDTIPVQPIKTILPHPVKSEKTKVDEKPRKNGNDNHRGNRVAPLSVVAH